MKTNFWSDWSYLNKGDSIFLDNEYQPCILDVSNYVEIPKEFDKLISNLKNYDTKNIPNFINRKINEFKLPLKCYLISKKEAKELNTKLRIEGLSTKKFLAKYQINHNREVVIQLIAGTYMGLLSIILILLLTFKFLI